MKPARFDMVRATTAEEAMAALSSYGEDGKILAGGQSLMPMLNMRLVRPKVLIDCSAIAEHAYIRTDKDYLRIGAATTQAMLLKWPQLKQAVPLLALAVPYVGHFQTRNRGTVCGSLCHADPSSEIPLSFALLAGGVVTTDGSRTRTIKAEDFQRGMLSTALKPGEMVIEARFPLAPQGARFAFHEVARRHGDFAIVSVAAMALNGTVSVGLGGVADRPVLRTWRGLAADGIDDVLADLSYDIDPNEDIHASARYRRELVRRMGRKAILEVLRAED